MIYKEILIYCTFCPTWYVFVTYSKQSMNTVQLSTVARYNIYIQLTRHKLIHKATTFEHIFSDFNIHFPVESSRMATDTHTHSKVFYYDTIGKKSATYSPRMKTP